MALAQGAVAVVIAGGVGLRLADYLPRSGFRDRFIAKGRFERRMDEMPVKLITHPQPGPRRRCRGLRQGARMTIDEIMRAAPVIPVLVLDGDEDWAKLADTFVGAGLPVLEVTLRTPGALDAIRRMSEVPGAIVGAGTVLNQRQLGEAVEAGARFIVSPGLTEPLARTAQRSGVPFFPASPPPATSCAASTWGSTGSNSFRRKHRAGSRR